MTLAHSKITGNRLNVIGPLPREGGGIYLDGARLRTTISVVADNSPDNCLGCS